MKKILILILLMSGCFILESYAQKVTLKSNLLYDATATMNLGLEFGLARKWTLDVPVNYNPWKPDNGRRLRHWGIQPEIRYWFCERFNRTFIGLHGHYADFNIGGWPDWSFVSGNMQQNRYQGHLYGAGLSYGYQWLLSNRWSMEAVIGVGWAHLEDDKYPCAVCGSIEKSRTKDYFGVTKAALSFIYFFK